MIADFASYRNQKFLFKSQPKFTTERKEITSDSGFRFESREKFASYHDKHSLQIENIPQIEEFASNCTENRFISQFKFASCRSLNSLKLNDPQ